ncbi:MAG: lipopolysaccharide biosynthesis protein RfbH [Candidatus Melainabacteria bacterium GWA2_34_9]|nr:MAG: lipopolysaccharide biosynthesis protein RfbH [Candidatus Melainabacteria bacterium GWA2_34_9]
MYNLYDKALRNLIKFFACIYYINVKKGQKSKYIPASGKVLDEKELFNMIDASLDMWLTTGRFNDEFEKKLSDFLNIKHCLTTNSGSSANLLALTALTSHQLGEKRLKTGNEVISVAAGFPTTINPIIQNGLIPVFIDVEVGSCNIKINEIEKSITEKTKAIFIAHTLGNPFNLEKIWEICEKYNLWLIEDSCDALGAKFNNKYTGTVGHIGTCSFYPAHHITMGEGGAVVTNDSQLYKILLSFRDWGRDCWCSPGKDDTCKKRFSYQAGTLPYGYDHKYIYSHCGYNMKITDWQASIACAQMDKLENFIQKRNRNYKILYEGFKKFEDYFILPEVMPETEPSWFGFLLSIKEQTNFNRLKLTQFLEENNIGTRLLFSGNILRQPVFVNNHFALRIRDSEVLYSDELTEEHYKMLPNTEFIMNNTFWIGVWPGLEEKDLNHILKTFEQFIKINI